MSGAGVSGGSSIIGRKGVDMSVARLVRDYGERFPLGQPYTIVIFSTQQESCAESGLRAEPASHHFRRAIKISFLLAKAH